MHIAIDKVSKHFGPVRANDGVSMTVAAGTIHGLLGENGAGKTTLMKILSGYQSADGGSVTLDGATADLRSPAEAIAAGVGMLHQDPMDVPQISVLDNFALGHGRALFVNKRQLANEMAALCERFGFALDPAAPAASLTIGERQQLEIARLLGLGVRTIILDEPTTGISQPQKVALFQTLRDLAADGLSVIFVSHKLEDVEALCTEATVLRQGRVAGHQKAPFDQDALVEMMFGGCLSDAARQENALGDIRLQLHGVAVSDQRLALRDVNLDVRAGEVIGLAGLEGSGQRILMEACAGLHKLDAGAIMLDGDDLARSSYHQVRQRGVAHVPAARLEEGMVAGLTIREHVALTGPETSLMVDWPQAQSTAESKVRDFNIIGQPDTPVESLSGGNQQRAMLALLPESLDLLLLEHPTRGLDIASTQWVWHHLKERAANGAVIVFTSTDLDELVENSDRVAVFYAGHMSEPLDASTITCDELGNLIGGRDFSNGRRDL